MMGVRHGVVIELEAAPAIAEVQFLQKVQGCEKLQRAIHRRQADIRIFILHHGVHVFHAHVIFLAIQERLQNDLPLIGKFILMLTNFLFQRIHDCSLFHDCLPTWSIKGPAFFYFNSL